MYVEIIGKIYASPSARIITDDIEGECFPLRKGVKQGDPLSPILFNCALEEIFRNLKWEERGIKIEAEKLNNLRFADNVVVVAENFEELELMLKELTQKSREASSEINFKKTKILTNEKIPNSVRIENNTIEIVEQTIYLGQLISLENNTRKEIQRRIVLAWNKYWSLKKFSKVILVINKKVTSSTPA